MEERIPNNKETRAMNEEIARYMGVKKHTSKGNAWHGLKLWYTGLPMTYQKHENSDYFNQATYVKQTMFRPHDLRYHCDWNWLMEVIQKITNEFRVDDETREMDYTINRLLCGLPMTLPNLWTKVGSYCQYRNHGFKFTDK